MVSSGIRNEEVVKDSKSMERAAHHETFVMVTSKISTSRLPFCNKNQWKNA